MGTAAKEDLVKSPAFSAGEAEMVEDMYHGVANFNHYVLGLRVPDTPTVPVPERVEWAVNAFTEETLEFEDACKAGDVAEASDALIDLIVFALGRLYEMAVPPRAVFDKVHDKNMQKIRGELSKRPGSMGYDAVKPADWTPPDHSWLTRVNARDLTLLAAMSPVLRNVIELRVKKDRDYNTGIKVEDYFPFGHMSYAQMLHVKTLRVRSLIDVIGQGKSPNFEAIEDSLLDVINYACFYAEALRKGQL